MCVLLVHYITLFITNYFVFSSCITVDVVKTRLQIGAAGGARNYKSLGGLGTVKIVAAEEGIGAFWKGIGAAWLREASYTSLRLGLYSPIKKVMGVTKDSNFFFKFSAGSLAGALGSIVGNPFDVLKTRMMATEGTATPQISKVGAEIMKTLICKFFLVFEVSRSELRAGP